MLANLLREPLLDTVDVDSQERIEAHRAILQAKPLMQGVCRELYSLCAEIDKATFRIDGSRIELGAGVSFIKEFFPDVLVTDVVPASHLDLVLDAQQMTPIQSGTVRAFYGIHCFHHFPEPRKFFSELVRTLKPGGGAILIEPYFGLLSRILYPHLFASERFDMNHVQWETPSAGSMSDANQALSYIVFFRDRARLLAEFPELEIVHTDQIRNYLRYLLSGGLNFRALVPAAAEPLLKALERIASPLRSVFALHQVIVLRKR